MLKTQIEHNNYDGIFLRRSQALLLVLLDAGANLERRSELDVHGAHQVVLLQQRQRLSVDFLPSELFHVDVATGKRADESRNVVDL